MAAKTGGSRHGQECGVVIKDAFEGSGRGFVHVKQWALQGAAVQAGVAAQATAWPWASLPLSARLHRRTLDHSCYLI